MILSIWTPGYPLRPPIVRIFTRVELGQLPGEDRATAVDFNEFLSSKRIVVEHLFGRLKARFPVFSQVRGRDHLRIWNLLAALLVVHNLLLDYQDAPGNMDGWEEVDPMRPLSEEDRQYALEAEARAEQGMEGLDAGDLERGKETARLLRVALMETWLNEG